MSGTESKLPTQELRLWAQSHRFNVDLISSDAELPAVMYSSWDAECLLGHRDGQFADHTLQSRGSQAFGDYRPPWGWRELRNHIPRKNTRVHKSVWTRPGGRSEARRPHTPGQEAWLVFPVTGPASQEAGRESTVALQRLPSRSFHIRSQMFFNKH